MKRINPFVELYKQCNASSNAERYHTLNADSAALPLYLDVELTNYCNLHCNMCPVGMGEMKRSKGFMNDDVFERVLDNIKRYHIRGVRFIRWGEPTLHPRFLDYAERLKKIGVLVHFNTNGLLLDDDMMEKIVDIGIDSVKFSFQGIDDLTYGEMRKGGSYSQLLDTIKTMHNIRGGGIIYISITTSTTYESDEEIMRFKEEVRPYCDEVTVGRTKMQHVDIEQMELSKERKKIYENYIKEDKGNMRRMSVCPEIWNKLSINWDGSVSACCQDYDDMMLVGNIMETDLQAIFMGEQEKYYREILKNSAYDKLRLCQNCYEYIALKH